jgi:hypothetical protein
MNEFSGTIYRGPGVAKVSARTEFLDAFYRGARVQKVAAMEIRNPPVTEAKRGAMKILIDAREQQPLIGCGRHRSCPGPKFARSAHSFCKAERKGLQTAGRGRPPGTGHSRKTPPHALKRET